MQCRKLIEFIGARNDVSLGRVSSFTLAYISVREQLRLSISLASDQRALAYVFSVSRCPLSSVPCCSGESSRPSCCFGGNHDVRSSSRDFVNDRSVFYSSAPAHTVYTQNEVDTDLTREKREREVGKIKRL